MAEYLTTAEVAELFQCSVATVLRRVADGTLNTIRLTPTGPLRYDRDSLPMEGNVMIVKRKDRGDWPYVDFYALNPNTGKKERIKSRCPSKNPKVCKQHEREVERQVADGTWWSRREKHTTFSDFLETAINELELATPARKPSYIHELKRTFNHDFIPMFGARAISSFKRADVLKYRKACEHLAKKTVNNRLGYMSRLLHLAVEHGIISSVPKLDLGNPKTKEAGFFTEAEAAQLVAACTGRMRAMVVVAIGTGLRIGELIALRWDDLALDKATLTVHRQWCMVDKDYTTPKGDTFRVVPLAPHVVKELRSWPKRLRCDLVFPTKHGTPIGKPEACKSFRRAMTRAKLKRAKGEGWHKCRHTCASWLVQRGVDLYRVQKWLGHTDIRETMRYAHLAPSDLASAAAVLG